MEYPFFNQNTKIRTFLSRIWVPSPRRFQNGPWKGGFYIWRRASTTHISAYQRIPRRISHKNEVARISAHISAHLDAYQKIYARAYRAHINSFSRTCISGAYQRYTNRWIEALLKTQVLRMNQLCQSAHISHEYCETCRKCRKCRIHFNIER